MRKTKPGLVRAGSAESPPGSGWLHLPVTLPPALQALDSRHACSLRDERLEDLGDLWMAVESSPSVGVKDSFRTPPGVDPRAPRPSSMARP